MPDLSDLLGLKGMSEAASKFAIKLVEVCQVGVGAIFAPWQIKRLARAEAEAAEIKRLNAANVDLSALKTDAEVTRLRVLAGVQVEMDAEQLRTHGKIAIEKLQLQGKHELDAYRLLLESRSPQESAGSDEPHVEWVLDDGTEIQRTPVDPLPERTRARLEFQEAKRQLNVEQVVGHAFNEHPTDDAVSDEPVDPDWIARFFDSVKDVSTAHLQKLWGRLLAGEISRPGTFPLRTLEVLKNLTSAEARLFERYCGFVSLAMEIVLPGGEDFAKAVGVKWQELMTLVECGLLHDAKDFIKSAKSGEEPMTLVLPGKALRFSAPPDTPRGVRPMTPSDLLNPQGKFRASFLHGTLAGSVFPLTGAGAALANLRAHEVNEAYFTAFVQLATEKGFNVEVVPLGQLDVDEPSTSSEA